MGDRIPSGSYFQYPPSGLHASPLRTSSLPSERERYLVELLVERQKLGPFMQLLPHCSDLIDQEIRRLTSGFGSSFGDHERFEHVSPHRAMNPHPNGWPLELERWPRMQREENVHMQRVEQFHAPSVSWPGQIEIPSNAPTPKFQEEKVLKEKPGYQHLNEPLHVVVKAQYSDDIVNARIDRAAGILENLLKPVDEEPLGFDQYKKQQLRELAMLNRAALIEESSGISGMKRAKTAT
jgi:protein quaking